MKNLSKVLAVVLALVMALSMVSFAAYTDVADDANYAEAVSVLSALEMLKGYEDGTFKPEGDITRAEFAMVVCRLIGSGAAAEKTGATQFADVAADHWASGAIALAAQNGIVNGYPDGTFKPDNNVLYEEAIKMVVAALGYTAVAETYGAYPTGYQIVAAQTGVLEGITDGKVGVAASRGVVAQLAYNALEVPLMTQTGFGTNVAYNYDNTLLLNKIGVVKVEATIEGTMKTGATTKADEVKITATRQFAAVKEDSEAAFRPFDTAGIKPDLTDVSWTTGKIKADADIVAQAEALVDYKVDAYVINPTTSNAKLVAIGMKDAGYSEITFAAEDINMNKTDIAAGDLAIYTDETKEAFEIYEIDFVASEENAPKVYLNGRESTALLASLDFLADTAEADIRLFDNDSDGTFEIAYVTAYVDYVVESLNARKYRVITEGAKESALFTSWPSTLVLDEENEDYSFEIIKDGEVVDFSAIAENDVLSVAGGLVDGELAYGTVIINTQTVSGTINGLDTENNIVIIDGVEYPYNDEVTPVLGDTADFYLNARGVICGLDETSKVGNLKYGFVTNAMKSSGLTSNTMELRMMDAEGTWNTYVLDKDYDLNGTQSTAATDIVTGITPVEGVYTINTLVAYELNADGEIDNIYTTAAADTDFVSDANTSNLAYNAATEIYNGNVLTDATVIFCIPESGVVADEDDVTIATKDVLVDRENYKMTAFNPTEDGEATILLGYGITGRIDWASNFMVITGKSTRTNAEGAVGVRFTGLVNGEEVVLFSSTETGGAKVYGTSLDGETIIEGSELGNASVLDKGDVVLYSVNGAGEAAKIVKVQDAATIEGHLDRAVTAVDLTDDGVDNAEIVPTFDATAVKVGTKEVAGVKYTYYLGYVATLKGTRLTIQDNMATAEDSKVLTLKAESVVTEIDFAHATGIKVTAGDLGSFSADSGITAEDGIALDGDIALIKTVNDVVVVEAVVFKAID